MIRRAVIKAVRGSVWLPFILMGTQILFLKSYLNSNTGGSLNDLPVENILTSFNRRKPSGFENPGER